MQPLRDQHRLEGSEGAAYTKAGIGRGTVQCAGEPFEGRFGFTFVAQHFSAKTGGVDQSSLFRKSFGRVDADHIALDIFDSGDGAVFQVVGANEGNLRPVRTAFQVDIVRSGKVLVGRKAQKRIGFHHRPTVARTQIRHANLRHADIAANPPPAVATGTDVARTDRRQEMDVTRKRLVPPPPSHLTVSEKEIRTVARPREVRSLHGGKRLGAVLSLQVMIEEVTGHERDVTGAFGRVVEISVVMVS